MAVEVNVETVSDQQLSDAVSRYGALVALKHVASIENDPPDAPDAMAVSLAISGTIIVAHVAAIIGGGAMLEYTEHVPSSDDVTSMFFAVRRSREAEHRGKWEINPKVGYGDGSISAFNKAARAAARYIFD